MCFASCPIRDILTNLSIYLSANQSIMGYYICKNAPILTGICLPKKIMPWCLVLQNKPRILALTKFNIIYTCFWYCYPLLVTRPWPVYSLIMAYIHCYPKGLRIPNLKVWQGMKLNTKPRVIRFEECLYIANLIRFEKDRTGKFFKTGSMPTITKLCNSPPLYKQ